MRSLSLVMSECSLGGHGQGHVSNFYIVDLENFATASRRFVYDTYKTMKATRSRLVLSAHVYYTLPYVTL